MNYNNNKNIDISFIKTYLKTSTYGKATVSDGIEMYLSNNYSIVFNMDLSDYSTYSISIYKDKHYLESIHIDDVGIQQWLEISILIKEMYKTIRKETDRRYRIKHITQLEEIIKEIT